jgi:hypothetical protein
MAANAGNLLPWKRTTPALKLLALLAFRDVLRTRHLNLIARIIDDDFFSNPFRDVVLIQREIPRD